MKHVHIDAEKVRKKLQAGARRLFPGVRAAMGTEIRRAEFEVVRQSFTGYQSGASRRPWLQNRSGTLRRSVGHKVTGSNLGNLQAKLGASAPYAKAHEYGRPRQYSTRGKKFWYMPAAAMLTPAGVMRRPITSWRGDRSAFFLRLKGNLKFVRRVGKGKNARLEVLYHLYPFPAPEIKPRLGIRKAVARAAARLPDRLRSVVRGALK
jgi:hypothetical protein